VVHGVPDQNVTKYRCGTARHATRT
jgi:hypothetical protein